MDKSNIEYSTPKHFKGWKGQRTDYEKGTYPSKSISGTIKDAGPKLGSMIDELVKLHDEVEKLTEDISEIEAQKEKEKEVPSKRRTELQQTLIPDLGKKIFQTLADSVGNMEEGAAHFRRYEEILLGIREAFEKETAVKVNEKAALWDFVQKYHPEVMDLAKSYINSLKEQVERVQTKRVVTTQVMDESISGSMRRGVKYIVDSIKRIFSLSLEFESLLRDYISTIESMED